MHTTYHKISARERDSAPRFYYKRTHKYSCWDRIKLAIRKSITFLFTQVGVCALVACYMATGAFMFASIEADSQMEQAVTAKNTRDTIVQELWDVTTRHNIIFEKKWRNETIVVLNKFQDEVVANVRKGYTGNDVGARVWTFSSALMYSLTVFTTIGYGNLTPKTDVGKLATIFYALVGIPLMLLYMTTIGSILATSFKYTYTKFCRCQQPSRTMPAKASLPSALVEAPMQATDIEKQSKNSSSRSKQSSNNSSSDVKSFSPIKHFKSFKKKRHLSKEEPLASPGPEHTTVGMFFRRPSIVVEQAMNCEDTRVEPEQNLNPPTTFLSPFQNLNSPSSYLLKSPAFLKSSMTPILDRKNKMKPPSSPASFRTETGASSPGDDPELPEVVPPPQKVATVEFKLVEDLRLVTIPVTSCLIVLASYIFLGTILFSTWEGWNYLDGAYFCFISLMTIGFGDFVPGNKYIYKVTEDENDEASSKAKLVIGAIYMLLGMAILAMCLNLMQEQIVVQVRTAARRLGLIRPTRYDEQDDI